MAGRTIVAKGIIPTREDPFTLLRGARTLHILLLLWDYDARLRGEARAIFNATLLPPIQAATGIGL